MLPCERIYKTTINSTMLRYFRSLLQLLESNNELTCMCKQLSLLIQISILIITRSLLIKYSIASPSVLYSIRIPSDFAFTLHITKFHTSSFSISFPFFLHTFNPKFTFYLYGKPCQVVLNILLIINHNSLGLR